MADLKTLIRRYFYVFNESVGRWLLLLGAFILTALLDVFGIGALGIYIQVIISPDGLDSVPYLSGFLSPAHTENPGNWIITLGVICFIFFGLRTVASYLLQVYMAHFNNRKQIRIQEHIFHGYLRSPLLFRKERSFSKMLYNINFLSNQFIYLFSNSLFNFSSNLVLFGIIAFFLAMTNFLACLAVCGLIAIAGGFYYFLIRDRSSFYGILLADATHKQLKNIKDGVGVLDEIQIIGCENFFESRVLENLETTFRYRLRSLLLNLIPRPMAEFILLGFILLFTLVYYQMHGSIAQIGATLGMFGMAGLRLVPAASQISACIHGMKNSSYAVHQLYDELKAMENEGSFQESGASDEDSPKFSFSREIRIQGLRYHYPDSTEWVLDGISFSIQKGDRAAIVGKSGSGKTTLMNLLLGNLVPKGGDILVDGVSINHAISAWRSEIFYMPQTVYILDDTIRQNIALGVEPADMDMDRMEAAVRGSQLEDLVRELPEGLDTQLGEQGSRLSGGQRQRIGIARALYHQRDVIVMDEPTSALDDETEVEVKSTLRNLPASVTVIMITHNLKESDIFNNIIRL